MKTKVLKMDDGVREVTQDEAFESVRKMLINISSKFYQYEFDDAFQIASIAFLKAWDKYNDTNIKFSTYLYRSANLNLMRSVELDNCQSRKFDGIIISMDKVADAGESGKQGRESVLNMFGNESMNIDAMIDCMEIKKIFNTLSDREKDIFVRIFILEESGAEIGRRYGIHRSRINQIKRKIVERMERAIYGKVS